jgi:hypothetical protein
MDLEYRALDVHFTARIFHEQRAELSTLGMDAITYDEAFPVTPLLWGMTARGMHVDLAVPLVRQPGIDAVQILVETRHSF